jgi:hypothetical protein
MKTFEIDKNSWHYRLANTYSNFEYEYEGHRNLCEYMRRVFYGALLAIVVAAVGGILAASFVCWIGAIILWPFIGFFEMSVLFIPAAIITTFIGVGLFAAMCQKIQAKYIEYRESRPRYTPVLKEPGFVTLAWRSFKEKTCVKITVK